MSSGNFLSIGKPDTDIFIWQCVESKSKIRLEDWTGTWEPFVPLSIENMYRIVGILKFINGIKTLEVLVEIHCVDWDSQWPKAVYILESQLFL